MVLTEQQQNLVSENEGLIYRGMKELNIPRQYWDDYYGTAAVGLCKAALRENNSRYHFSSLAVKIIKDELITEFRKENALKRGGCVTVIPIHDIEEVGSEKDYEDMCIERLRRQEFLNLLNKHEKEVFRMLLAQKTYKEIAEEKKICRSRVQVIVKDIRRKFKEEQQ